MGFTYKTLSSNDTTLTSYISNKLWEVENPVLSENGIRFYVGENLPINIDNPFNPNIDSVSTNGEYRRLLYDSIRHLYYENYTSGSLTGQFFESSSLFNYEQSTLTSGSMLSSFKNIPTQTGSIGTPIYDETPFDADRGGKILIISIDQNLHGSGLIPTTVYISGSTYYLRDDGEGNIFDFRSFDDFVKYGNDPNEGIYSIDRYLGSISGEPGFKYVGNVFYSQGLIIITDEDYLCILGLPPTTLNDYFTFHNLEPSKSLDIIANDFSDCGELTLESFISYSIDGYTFPDFNYNGGIIDIIPTQASLIPGEYKIGYTIENTLNLTSNTASVNLTITSEPLQIIDIISSSVCFDDPSIVPVTFSINQGVPYYSYSLDEGDTYIGVNELFNVTISGSVTASSNNIIYVKDYLGEIVTQSFSSWYPEVLATINIQKLPCTSTSNDGKIFVDNDQTAVSASINGISQALPSTFTGIPTGSIEIELTSSFGCTTSSFIDVGVYPPLTASVTQSNPSCIGSNDGSIIINLTNVIDTLKVDLTNTYAAIPLSDFPNNSVTAFNLETGSYLLEVYSQDPDECQYFSQSFNITDPQIISFSVTASYINSCSNQALFNDITGGNPPYTYFALTQSPSSQKVTSSVSLFEIITGTDNDDVITGSFSLNLNTLNGGNYITYIIDNNGCQSPTSSLSTFSRQFIYSGSICEIEKE